MIKGAIAGGLTGTVLGLINPGTGATGAVVGSVAGGVTGYAEGAILGYLGCKLLQPTELEENEEEDVKTLLKQNS